MLKSPVGCSAIRLFLFGFIQLIILPSWADGGALSSTYNPFSEPLLWGVFGVILLLHFFLALGSKLLSSMSSSTLAKIGGLYLLLAIVGTAVVPLSPTVEMILVVYFCQCLMVAILGWVVVSNAVQAYNPLAPNPTLTSLSTYGWRSLMAFLFPSAWFFHWWYLKKSRALLLSGIGRCPHCGGTCSLEPLQGDSLGPFPLVNEEFSPQDCDLWICEACQSPMIILRPDYSVSFSDCPSCHRKGRHLIDYQVLQKPSPQKEGKALAIHQCQMCSFDDEVNVPLRPAH